MFTITMNFITGMMVGIEYVFDDEDEIHHLALDLFIVRFLFSWC
jgi:hypothetical protein